MQLYNFVQMARIEKREFSSATTAQKTETGLF